ncbi:MAG: SpoIIE family protein phosphatase [Lachnospiraceae bacterium]|nr:SpoIIE family protein phosphatase [Lachnospiraceae bacterium]
MADLFGRADRRIRRLLTLMCLALLFLLPAASASAAEDLGDRKVVDPVRDRDKCTAVIYNNTNGLATSEANDIVTTEDGFIWIGSYSGLTRYDGTTFEQLDEASGISSVVCLLADRNNRLWIGTNDRGLAMMEQGQVRMWSKADGLGSDKICDIEENVNGVIYVATTGGITMIYPDMTMVEVQDHRIMNNCMEQVVRGYDGLMYGITSGDDFFTMRDGEVIHYIGNLESPVRGVTSILPDPDNIGKLYIGTQESQVFYGDPINQPEEIQEYDISPLTSVTHLRLIDGKIWICARNGIGVLDEDGFHSLADLPMNNSIYQAVADYEGNLWFASSRQGVMKLTYNRFTDVFAGYGLEECVVNSTCIYEDKLFVATDTGLIVLDRDKRVESLPLKSYKAAYGEVFEGDDLIQVLEGARIRSVISDSQGYLWISTYRSPALIRYANGEAVAFTKADGLYSDHVRAVYETSDGKILVACTGGVCVIEGKSVIAKYGRPQEIVNQEILTVCEGENGDILAGSNGGGIYVLNPQGTRCIDSESGLGTDTVMRIKKDNQRDIYWIVGSNSIAYMDKDYQVTSVKNLPYFNNFDLYQNSKDDMWVISSNGIYVIPTEELLADQEIHAVHYGLGNGMACTATSNSYGELTDAGDLYIPGSAGVVKVNIEEPIDDVSDLKMAIPYLDADGRRIYPDEKGNFQVPPKVQKLTVYAYVFNYSLTDPKVSYRLEGFDRDYVTKPRSEFEPVYYTNLPGGNYRFVMQLKDALGRESAAMSVEIAKEKAFYEETWFYIVAVLAAFALISVGVLHYVRRKTREMERRHQEALEHERITSEMQMAKAIQESMLPHQFPPFPDRTEFEIYASMTPARDVGGDFYDFFLIDDDHLCMVIADVSGKGVPAALFMMISKVILQSCAMLGRSAAEILTKTNEGICSDNSTEMFVTVWLGILEISTGKITAANAGHEYPALMQTGRFELLKDKHGLVIGGMEGIRYKEYEIQLKPGDKVFVYTDGVPEATDTETQMFGTNRMLEALNLEPEASTEKILTNVHTAVNEFVGEGEQFDDLTMLCLEYKGKPQAE